MLESHLFAFFCFAASAIVATVTIPFVRRIAIKRGLLDVPNERSSHKVPTPRTGGIGIVTGIIVGVSVSFYLNDILLETKQIFFLVALLTGATVGFLDDIFRLPTTLRMLLYLASASGLAFCGATVSRIDLPGFPVFEIGSIYGRIFSALFIAWYANLFNFMDGIDGIAGSAAVVTLGALSIEFLLHGETIWGLLALASAAATVGFLLYNYPPATVFMGDGGAVLLGLTIGGLSLVSVEKESLVFPAVVFLMFPFVFDASFTLIRRIINQERFWAAHRTHVYQQLCDLGLSHRAVTIIYTTAAVFFAAIGLYYEAFSPLLRFLSFWGTAGVLLSFSVFVVYRNKSRKYLLR